MNAPVPVEQAVKQLPEHSGVYIYRNSQNVIIYIGKAVNLKKRIRQYFQREDAVGEKTPLLVAEIATIETRETTTEFEALLLEAKLIKEYTPKYNVIAKDDKSPLYILIDFSQQLPVVALGRKSKIQNLNLYFGPFQSSKVARNLMRSLRRVVPYCTQKIRNGRRCFYTHLGLCNPCPSYISKLQDDSIKSQLSKQYRAHIFRLRDILSGKAVSVIADMEKEMASLANNEQYEDAASVRNQLAALRSLLSKKYDPSVYTQSDTLLQELFDQEKKDLITTLRPYYPKLTHLQRIECYDISNTQGVYATASMVVLTDGRTDTDEYRKFRIKTIQGPNDFAMMQEVLTRRSKHPEWASADLIVVDGGKGQVSAALEIIAGSIPIIGLAKREEEIIVPYNGTWKVIRLPFSSGALKMLQRLRDEAHRFSKKYHTTLRDNIRQ